MKHSYYIATHHISHLMREVEYYIINSQVLAPRALVCIPRDMGALKGKWEQERAYILCILMTFILHMCMWLLCCANLHMCCSVIFLNFLFPFLGNASCRQKVGFPYPFIHYWMPDLSNSASSARLKLCL